MSDPTEFYVCGANFDEFSRSLTAAIKQLPRDFSQQLNQVRREYFTKYGFDAAYQRMNNRKVSQIISEYEPTDVKPIASGELDGAR